MARQPGPVSTPTGKLASANAAFAWELYRELGKCDLNRNLFFSPGSVSVALAMTYLGARENTAAEMRRALKFEGIEDSQLHQSFTDLLQAYQKTDSLTLRMANRLYGEQRFQILDRYLEESQKFYQAELAKVNFSGDFEGARIQINDWVSEMTSGKIKDLLQSGTLDALTRLVLVNAVYFKGDWKLKFDPKNTKPVDFTALDGSKTPVPMMSQKDKFSYGVHDTLHAQAIELPYVGDSMSFVIMLPEAGKYEQFENNIKLDDIVSFEKSFRMAPNRDVRLWLPKFRMEDSFGLSDTLASLGIKELFSESAANLSGIDPQNNLYVSKVVHKAFLEVNEEGSEAAAATAVVMMMRCLPKTFEVRCDRPFMFFIRENTTRSILFLGRMTRPVVSGQ